MSGQLVVFSEKKKIESRSLVAQLWERVFKRFHYIDDQMLALIARVESLEEDRRAESLESALYDGVEHTRELVADFDNEFPEE